jgi:hypothetical protein
MTRLAIAQPQTAPAPYRRQARIPGARRLPVHSAFASQLETAIQREMRRYKVSRSFVIASCCAYALGVEAPDHRIDPRTTVDPFQDAES